MTPLRTCRVFAVAGAITCVLVNLPAVHAQSTQPSSEHSGAQQSPSQQASPQQASPATTAEGEDGSKLPVSLDRIREGVQRDPKLKIDFLDPNIPLFRIHVQENAIELSDYWKIGPDTAVSRDVRPFHASAWHNEFLRMTTPPQQIAASPFGMFGNPMYPVGLSIPWLSKGLKQFFTDRERARIRRQIQEELKAIEANKSQQTQQQQTPQTQTQQPSAESAPKQPAPRNPNDPQ